ncbi:MAG: hypothetical protein Hals2KO_14740 [Halioglobus sp.]
MSIEHLAPTTPTSEVLSILERDGCVVIDNLLDSSIVEAILLDMEPHLTQGTDRFAGYQTRRAGLLVSRSVAGRELVTNKQVLDIAAGVLGHASSFQLHTAQMLSVGPGAEEQLVHRDQWTFDRYPFPQGFEVTFATMWALSDFTEANGATRIIPGSHKLGDGLTLNHADAEPVAMRAGSVMLYYGSTYHGAGANLTQETRHGLTIQYTLGWLRQEENQYLGVPQSVLEELPEDLLRLMGYEIGAYSLGFFDNSRDPIAAIRPDLERL